MPNFLQGYVTYIGAAIKLFSALIALLTMFQGTDLDLNAIAARIMDVLACFTTGAAISTIGMRRALGRSSPAVDSAG